MSGAEIEGRVADNNDNCNDPLKGVVSVKVVLRFGQATEMSSSEKISHKDVTYAAAGAICVFRIAYGSITAFV